MVSLVDIVPTVLDWFGLQYPHYKLQRQHVILTGQSLLPLLKAEPITGRDRVYASHDLHEVTMYYPMRVLRTKQYKLIQNHNYKMPFPIDQDFYISKTFQDLLYRTRRKEALHWSKTLKSYYYRQSWELFDLTKDPHELTNVAHKSEYGDVFKLLKTDLNRWQNITADPWICSPWGVLESTRAISPVCLPLDNMLDNDHVSYGVFTDD